MAAQRYYARIFSFLIGKGQRGLTPPKAGKTMMLQNIAYRSESSECYLIVLLTDERPKSDRSALRQTKLASTFDEPANRHVQVAESN